MTDKDKIQEKEIRVLLPHPDKQIPKLASSMNVSIDGENLILTFLYSDNTSSASVLIDRILVTKKHAKDIIEVLERTISDDENK